MSKYDYSDAERKVNSVLLHQSMELSEIHRPSIDGVNTQIAETEALLRSLGYGDRLDNLRSGPCAAENAQRKVMVVPSWEKLCAEAEECVGTGRELEDIFTPDELKDNQLALRRLEEEFNQLHRLDKFDIALCAAAGLLSAAVDLLLVGIPQKTVNGLKGGPLADYVRDWFDKKYPSEEMEKLANSKASKVSFDAQDNRNTSVRVEGLSAYYHRLLSLGHDPLLGLVVGVFDILTGRMTTIDKSGKVVSQIMECYADRRESDVFAAIAKQIAHFKSDMTTSMGLPAPLMGLFNLLQFGSIGEEEQTIAEIVQGMYYEGYDFIHFCTLSIPVMIIEVITRLGYAVKRIREGHSVKESIPFSLNREKHPKLATMLFVAHSAATAVNAGKVVFTKNPMAINYPQWLAFANYSYRQLKWVLIEKPQARDVYINGVLCEEHGDVYDSVEKTFREFSAGYTVVME